MSTVLARVRTPGSSSSTRSRQHLPPKLVQDGAKRLAFLAPVSVGIIVAVEVSQSYLQPAMAPVLEDPINRLLTIATVFFGLGIFALHRYRVVSATTLLRLGTVFFLVVGACVSMVETTKPFSPDATMIGMSSLGVWIFVVGAFIPNRPTSTLVVALATASMWPAAYLLNMYRIPFDPLPLRQLAIWPGVNYLLAVLAFVVGRRLYGATVAAERAVELGSYRLVAPIGEGGMGEVWQATHQMLARKAAIKLVRPEGLTAVQSETAAKRFQREANIIAGLQSPHTVYLYDFGSSHDGRFYYVMELLDGISLQTLVAKFGPQPAGRVAHIVRQICESLEEAHRNSMVHRDLKPSNIMLCKVALAHDFVKVLDFGLAKCIAKTDITQLTMEGVASGTPGYIAPEIALGERTVDHRADLYALGCVSYFLLTGTLVFHDPNPVTMALKHVQAEPDAPSLRTELPIPPSLERVVLQCLAKKPADRPSSAREVAAAVSACDVTAWTTDDAEAWWAHHLPPSSVLRSYGAAPVHTPHIVQKA
jgi:tRNA A-37 threonylcarbamoyl transferase component Bud32